LYQAGVTEQAADPALELTTWVGVGVKPARLSRSMDVEDALLAPTTIRRGCRRCGAVGQQDRGAGAEVLVGAVQLGDVWGMK